MKFLRRLQPKHVLLFPRRQLGKKKLFCSSLKIRIIIICGDLSCGAQGFGAVTWIWTSEDRVGVWIGKERAEGWVGWDRSKGGTGLLGVTGGECVPQGVIPSSTGSEVCGLPLSAANWELLECSKAHGSSCPRASWKWGSQPCLSRVLVITSWWHLHSDPPKLGTEETCMKKKCIIKVHYHWALNLGHGTCQVTHATLAHFFFSFASFWSSFWQSSGTSFPRSLSVVQRRVRARLLSGGVLPHLLQKSEGT